MITAHLDFGHFVRDVALQDSSVVFIDMRGSLGDLLCTKGDVNYDLSKVYQSLCGYDFHILDKEVGQKAVDILEDLKQVNEPRSYIILLGIRSQKCSSFPWKLSYSTRDKWRVMRFESVN